VRACRSPGRGGATKTEELVGINGTAANQQKPFSRARLPAAPDAERHQRVSHSGMVALAKNLNAANPILPYRTPLAVITRDHAPSGRKVPADPETAKTSYVNRYGDPLGLKSSTWVSLLAPIRDRNHPMQLRRDAPDLCKWPCRPRLLSRPGRS
jgi:hypothetical protein